MTEFTSDTAPTGKPERMSIHIWLAYIQQAQTPGPAADTFTRYVAAARANLLNAMKEGRVAEADSFKMLESLLKHHTDRMLSDNERIWRTGALFIPISLAAFAALTAIKCLQVWQILVLGGPSIALMLAWVIVAENHRAFQQRSEAWVIAIQNAMGLETPLLTKLDGGGREASVSGKRTIQKVRWGLLYFVVIAWLLILIGACVSWLYQPRACLMPT